MYTYPNLPYVLQTDDNFEGFSLSRITPGEGVRELWRHTGKLGVEVPAVFSVEYETGKIVVAGVRGKDVYYANVITPDGTQEIRIGESKGDELLAVGLWDNQVKEYWRNWPIEYSQLGEASLVVARQGEMILDGGEVEPHVSRYVYWNGEEEKRIDLRRLSGGVRGWAVRPPQYWGVAGLSLGETRIKIYSFLGEGIGEFVCENTSSVWGGIYDPVEDIAVAIVSPAPIVTIHKGNGAPLFAFSPVFFKGRGLQVFCERGFVYIGYEINPWVIMEDGENAPGEGYLVDIWHIEKGYCQSLVFEDRYPYLHHTKMVDKILERYSNMCLIMREKRGKINIGDEDEKILLVASLVFSGTNKQLDREMLGEYWHVFPTSVLFRKVGR